MTSHGSPQNCSGNATRSSAFTTSGTSSKPETNNAQPPEKHTRRFVMTPVTSYRNIGWDTSTTSYARALKTSPIDCSGTISSHSARKLSEYTAPASHPYQMCPSASRASRSCWKESTRARHLTLTRFPVACYKNCTKDSLLSSPPFSEIRTSLEICRKSESHRGSPVTDPYGIFSLDIPFGIATAIPIKFE